MLSAFALQGLAEVRPGDDLPALISSALALEHRLDRISDDDVVVVAHKIVSKAEGRIRSLQEVRPGARARELAAMNMKDPRHVQVVLEESREVLRAARGVLICVTHQGFVCANAGVDFSNLPDRDAALLLPKDPDASARLLRAGLRSLLGAAPAVLITDSFGRAWRHGQCDVAIGCAGIAPLEDWRGHQDACGRELTATWIAIADELAAAADLLRSKDSSEPVVIIRGAARHVSAEDGPGAAAMIRPRHEDLFR